MPNLILMDYSELERIINGLLNSINSRGAAGLQDYRKNLLFKYRDRRFESVREVFEGVVEYLQKEREKSRFDYLDGYHKLTIFELCHPLIQEDRFYLTTYKRSQISSQ